MNLIVAKNNTIVTLHLDDEECDIKRLAPYGELHGDVAPSLHCIAPHAIKCHVGLHKLVVFPLKLLKMEFDIKLMTAPSSTSILEISLPSM
jgi:hypothetical protein